MSLCPQSRPCLIYTSRGQAKVLPRLDIPRIAHQLESPFQLHKSVQPELYAQAAALGGDFEMDALIPACDFEIED